jgi:hypothetical protein
MSLSGFPAKPASRTAGPPGPSYGGRSPPRSASGEAPLPPPPRSLSEPSSSNSSLRGAVPIPPLQPVAAAPSAAAAAGLVLRQASAAGPAADVVGHAPPKRFTPGAPPAATAPAPVATAPTNTMNMSLR